METSAIEQYVINEIERYKKENVCLDYLCRFKKDQFEAIEHDLEILDIMKKHYDTGHFVIGNDKAIVFWVLNYEEGYEKVKEWLKNDK